MVLTKRNVSRRGFLKSVATIAGGAAALPAFNALGLLQAKGRVQAAPGAGGYGPISPKPDLRDGVERISLPDGFTYRSFSSSGTPMSDGNLVPLALDGMAGFNMPDGGIRLVRNHEDRNDPGEGTTGGSPKYDELGGGGTTTLEINPVTRELVADWVSITGTIVNCAGGTTPWGSWLTCEETNEGTPHGWGEQHGYCFDVPASANLPVNPVALKDLGRFSHEAVAVDPKTSIVYETEDNGSDSGFYRFVSNQPGNLQAGGVLQMLAVDGMPQYLTRTGQTVGKKLPVAWVDIEDPDPPLTGDDDVDESAVFNQGWGNGAARFRRLEGCWWGNGAVYFNATDGGDSGRGQVWEYRPTGNGGGWLTLVYESPDLSVLNFPDNIAVSSQGALLLCEDAPGFDQFLRGVTLEGEIFDFAYNLETNREWAGATFVLHGRGDGNSDDKIMGQHATLFVNRQGPTSGPNVPDPGDEGMTFAIWGPWANGAL